MTTLAAEAPRDYNVSDFQDDPVITTDVIYKGAAAGNNTSGYVRPFQADDPFRVIANYKEADKQVWL